MHNRNKIAIFHTEFFYSGGAEKLIFNQAKYLEELGHTVDVYTAYIDRNSSFPDIINNFKIYQLLPTCLNRIFTHKVMIIITILAFPLWVNKLKNYDYYIGENQVGPWLAFLSGFINKRKYFTYQPYPTTFTRPRRIDKQRSFIYKLFAELDKYIIAKAETCFANGLYAKEILEKVYKREFVNCSAGANRQIFNKKIFDKRIINPYILVTNRNMPAKRLDWAEKVVPKKIKLIKIGQMTDFGYVTEEKLHNYYKNALVYIYTAPEEDFGIGIIEAMSYGVPPVAWNFAGPTGIIQDGVTGYLAKPYDLVNYKKLVSELVENRKLNYKIAKAAYEESKKYTWQRHVKILEKYFLLQ